MVVNAGASIECGDEVWSLIVSASAKRGKECKGGQLSGYGKQLSEMTYPERLIKLEFILLVYDREKWDLLFIFQYKNDLIDLDIL